MGTRGGRRVYVYSVVAIIHRPAGGQTIRNGVFADVADNDDEAYGRAIRICEAIYPKPRGYFNHSGVCLKIEDLSEVSRVDIATLNEWPLE